ncbi:MAG: hypothetical protein HY303_18280 [Candidatus Wallbacteria bacterium]|nr:hypothetical protein [Candidatus Wallbacteria bacterium]
MLVVLGVLSLVIALGFTFSRFSRQTGLDVYRQVDTLRARWLARGALAKAFVVLRREMEAHYYGWSFPDQRVGRLLPEQFEGALGDGTWKVVSVEPLTFHRGEATIGPYRNRPYRRHGESLGYYDVFKIVTEGYVPRTTTGVRMTSLVKIVRKRVAPQ